MRLPKRDYAALAAAFTSKSSSGLDLDVLDGFSSEQQAVIKMPAGVSLVLRAGAGAGKTKVLVERVARLLRLGANPERVLVVSFTRAAAGELRDRLRQKLPAGMGLPTCSTLHALALRLVKARREVSLQLEVPDAILSRLKSMLGDVVGQSDADLLTTLGRHREALSTKGTYGLVAEELKLALREAGLDDFTSLIEEAQVSHEAQFDYVLVDEAQDLSAVQLAFVDRLTAKGGAQWFVGDDDQAIYAFRGAGSGLLTELAARPGMQEAALTINWRCPRLVVEAANRLLAQDAARAALTWAAAPSAIAGSLQMLPMESRVQEVIEAELAAATGCLSVVLGRTNKALEPFQAVGLPTATVHEAKGREWPHVWVTRAEVGGFPLAQAELAEERRLFYVAMTRAKESLVLAHKKDAPSDFLAAL